LHTKYTTFRRTFVAKHLADFKNPIEAADHEALENRFSKEQYRKPGGKRELKKAVPFKNENWNKENHIMRILP
jgi:hypothetical protein